MTDEQRTTDPVASQKPASYFRGYWSIQEVRGRVMELADWLKANRPSCRQITLKTKDYDLVRRWPKAAGLLGFTVTDTGAVFDGFELRRAVGRGRYETSLGRFKWKCHGCGKEEESTSAQVGVWFCSLACAD